MAMFNQTRLQEALTAYKKDFVAKQWKNEKYKWEAVKWFQDNWDIDATDFAEMLERSLEKTSNLLSSANSFPKRMIVRLSKAYTKEVKAMFLSLFDERKEIFERIEEFKAQANVLIKKFSDRDIHHYQTEKTISTYLWLRYPEKYYIYKFMEAKDVADKLESNYQFKQGAYKDNINNFLSMYDELNSLLKQDAELTKLLQSQLTESCYPDTNLNTLTGDVVFYISRRYPKRIDEDSIETDIDPTDITSKARFKRWFMPIIDTLIKLGGNAPRQEVHEKIIEDYHISNEDLEKKSDSGVIFILNDIDWARNYLNYEGFLSNDTPKGIWGLNDLGKKIIIDDNLAGQIVAKWIRIKNAKRKGTPIPDIDLSPYYKYREKSYTADNFLRDVYMSETKYKSLVALLLKKKNIILQGAPGVGKTFVAKRLSYSIMGEKDTERVMLVQFHQSYSYEDFIMGYRPTKENFEIHTGAFYDFCKKAADDNENDYYCIIDEINRGNLNKIFGELFMLLEADKRGEEIRLLYKDENFSVPPNLYLIGTMNTADRSLAMLDYALRRRFSFFEILPGFDTDGFQSYQKELSSEKFDNVIRCIKNLNDTIAKDETLGEGFCIGHSYFCGLTPEELNDESLSSIVEYDIIPLIKEYWFDEPAKVRDWSERLRRALQ